MGGGNDDKHASPTEASTHFEPGIFKRQAVQEFDACLHLRMFTLSSQSYKEVLKMHDRHSRLERLKVLLSAYACEPHRGSEPGVGWNWALQAARHGHEVHVITRSTSRTAIENYKGVPAHYNLHFHYLELPAPLRTLERKLKIYGEFAYYYLWQVSLWRRAAALHRAHRFDLAHHVTFCTDWMPSGLALVNLPFIYGPVGGSSHAVPPGIAAHLPQKARLAESIRRLVQEGIKLADPFARLTKRRAERILTYTQEAIEGIHKNHHHKTEAVVHIGATLEDIPKLADDIKPLFDAVGLKVLSNGRLVYWKGYDLLILGFAEFVRRSRGDAQLLISGDGPYRPHLEAIIQELGMGRRIRLLGHLPHRDDVYRSLAECDLYALPTFRDGPPVAILEAMNAGCPILCLNLGAPKEMVPKDAGIRVDGTDFNTLVSGIAEALDWAYHHRDALPAMGERAQAHARTVHDWQRIGDELNALYQKIHAETRGGLESEPAQTREGSRC